MLPPEHAVCRLRTPGEWSAVVGAEIRREPIAVQHKDRLAQGWQYGVREGRRKACDEIFEPPEGICWERNLEAGRNGWERFDHTEETYWRRPSRVTVARPAGPDGAAAFDEWLVQHGVELWDVAAGPGVQVVVDFVRNVLEYESAVQNGLHGATLVWEDRGEPAAEWVIA